jgi:hypothetical protein
VSDEGDGARGPEWTLKFGAHQLEELADALIANPEIAAERRKKIERLVDQITMATREYGGKVDLPK